MGRWDATGTRMVSWTRHSSAWRSDSRSSRKERSSGFRAAISRRPCSRKFRVRFAGTAYRAHDPRWSWTPLSGEGARIHGGRFNPQGVPALYLALDFATAVIEANQGFPFRLMAPLTLVSYAVDCDDLEDLSDAKVLQDFGATAGDLACAWKLLSEGRKPVPSWRLVERLRSVGTAGIVVPSFSPGAAADARNLVLWRWSADLPYQVLVIDPEKKLPRDGSSWTT
jgi:RES domain-containing protein